MMTQSQQRGVWSRYIDLPKNMVRLRRLNSDGSSSYVDVPIANSHEWVGTNRSN